MSKITNILKPLGLTASTIVATAALLQSAPAQAIELVSNGDFNNGLTDWTSVGNVSVQNLLGNNFARLGTGSGSLSQSLSTVVGTNYTLSYDFATFGSLNGRFESSINGNVLSTLGPGILPTLTSFSFNFVGTGTDNLSFNFSNVGTLFRLGVDNVSVQGPATTSVPEPFTVVGTLVGGTAALRMKKKLKSSAKG